MAAKKEFTINMPDGSKQLFNAFEAEEKRLVEEDKKLLGEFASPEEIASQAYPVEVWDGTLYGEFAELCTKDNHIAKELFIEGLKTVVGSVVGNQLCTDTKGGFARQSTIAVAPPGSGKDTAFDGVQEIFRGIAFDTEGQRGSYLSSNEVAYKNIGARFVNAASENALIDAASVCPRVFLAPPELGSLISKGTSQGYGASLLDVIRRSFDSIYPNFSTAERRKKVPEVMYLSMLTSIQPETLEQIGMGSGLPSRITWIVPPPLDVRAVLRNPVLGDWPVRMFNKLLALEQISTTIKVSREANAVIDEWLAKVKSKEYQNEIAVRINILVMRNALHLAWLHDQTTITPEVMGKAMRLGDWQLNIRDSLFVAEATNDVATYQIKIKTKLRRKGPMTRSKLRDSTHAERVGTEIFDRALRGLLESKQIKALPSERRNSILYGIPPKGEQDNG